jgi:YD repeat-containing protein
MTLEKKVVRDGRGQIIGSVTSGFNDESTVVRDADNQIVGRTSDRFHTTRDEHGNLVSRNSADPGLLIRPKK